MTEDEHEGGLYTLSVEHSFDSGREPLFTKRGTVTLHSLKSGVAEFLPDEELSDQQRQQIKELARNNGIYRIRVGRLTTDENSMNYLYSFVKACALVESRLSDIITIHVDHAGSLIGVSFTTTAPYCSGQPVSNADLMDFNTTIDVQQSVIGPMPETQAYIQKVEMEKQQAKGQQVDNRSFFAKYWMYLVPLVIFMMLIQNVDPNAGQGGGRS